MRPLNREILRLAVPSILANITVPLVGMVDMAVAGHLDAAAAVLIGGISIGSMLFDLLYWNFSFLRVGTGGLTAQAWGRGDRAECARILWRALLLALFSAVFLLAIQVLVVKVAFRFVNCTPEVQELAVKYFYIRIWAAPATLSLFAFKGWFIGMQDTVSAMASDLIVNFSNIALSILLAFRTPLGYTGIAWGTVIAQWTGLLFCFSALAFKYREVAFGSGAQIQLKGLGRFFAMNGDLLLRSLGLILVYIGFTAISARYGDALLASASILMKILLIFSYFTDGFAYAGEALTGRFIGARDAAGLNDTVKYTFIWSMSIAVFFIGIYGVAGVPLLGCPAFTWDGIYLGATASGACRDSSLLSAAGFFAIWFAGNALFHPSGAAAIHLLMVAYFVHLAVRTLYQTVFWKKYITFTQYD